MLDGLERKLVVSSGENHPKRQRGTQLGQQFKAAHFGHLHIQKKQFGRVGLQGLEGFACVVEHGHHLHFWAGAGEFPLEGFCGVGFVVHEDGSDGFHG